MRHRNIFFTPANQHHPVSKPQLRGMETRVAKLMSQLLAELRIDESGDPNTAGTAQRVAKLWCREVFAGRFGPPPKLTTFPNRGQDDMVITGPISVRSTCSHHLCPIMGNAWIGLLYGNRVAGLSKFNRVVEWFATRPQIQEELTSQVADYIEKELQPRGVAVVLTATHTCMTWRGVREHPEARMTTSVMRGIFRTKPEARQEFLALMANK